jgi:hypothetical protein
MVFGVKQLKLKALDSEDLEVISSCCQDGILKIGEMRYDSKQQQFIVTFNRFTWENPGRKERRRSALHFDRVSNVKLMGLNRDDKETVTSLLAIQFVEEDAPAGTIELVFAGDGAIRLSVECIEAQLTDMPAAWEAQSIPDHEQD